MRLIPVSAALAAHCLASTGTHLVAQGESAFHKVFDVSIDATYGLADPSSGRFTVYANSQGIHVIDPRTGRVTATIDRTTAAIRGSYFAGLLSISASGKRLVFIASGESDGPGYVWSVDLDSTSGRPVSPPHRVSIMPAEAARLSDDGRWIALVTVDGPEDRGTQPMRRLLVMPSDGGDERVLDTAGRIQTPHWTPDGKTIYYVRGRGNGPALARIAATGGTPDSLAPASAVVGVSPDGRRIAYYPAGFSGERFPLRIADLEGREIGTVGVGPSNFFFMWSRRDPATLLGRHDDETTSFKIVSLDNGKVLPYSQTGGLAMYPRLSPDGRRLAAVAVVGDRARLVVFDAKSSQRRAFEEAPAPDGASLQWSPGGSHIAYLALDASLTRHELYVVDVATARATRLADLGPARSSYKVLFRWRSDGQSIDYITGTSFHRSVAVLERVALSGARSVVRKLPSVPHGVGSTGGYRLLNDSLIAISRSDLETPADSSFLAVVDTRSGAVRTLSDRFAYWFLGDNADVLSPDGKWLAFGSGRGNQNGSQWAVASLDGRTVRLLGEPMGCRAWPSAWLPDSRALIAVGVESCDAYNEKLYVVPVDGGPVRHVTVPANEGVALTPDGRSLVVAAVEAKSTSIFALDLTKALRPVARPTGTPPRSGKN